MGIDDEIFLKGINDFIGRFEKYKIVIIADNKNNFIDDKYSNMNIGDIYIEKTQEYITQYIIKNKIFFEEKIIYIADEYSNKLNELRENDIDIFTN